MTTATNNPPACLEDIFNDDIFGLLEISDEQASLFVSPDYYQLNSRKGYVAGEGELTATQAVCQNFHSYEQILAAATEVITSGNHRKIVAHASAIAAGDIFVFNGIVAIVADIRASEERSSGQKHRAHVVYANGTESHLLLSSLVSKTYKPNCYQIIPNQSQAK